MRRGGMGPGGAEPLSRKFVNFSSQNGVIWCTLGVLFLRFTGHIADENDHESCGIQKFR